jgi:hypothetical protein
VANSSEKVSKTEYIVVVGSYNILRVKNVQSLFSQQVQEMLDKGWLLRGELKMETTHVKVHGTLSVYVTLAQNMVKEEENEQAADAE